MSWVTDIILVTSIHDDAGSQQLDAWLRDNYPGYQFARIDDKVIGPRAMRCHTSIAAVNCFDLMDFLSAFSDIQWTDREEVQLMIKEDDENIFTVYGADGM